MISIHSKWCKLIFKGIKSIEVRKTRPKIDTPFKCYIYESKSQCGSGQVIGEFVCDRIINIECDSFAPFDKELDLYINKQICMGRNEFIRYTNTNCAYGWHISNFVLYGEPKEITEFKSYYGCRNCKEKGTLPCLKICTGKYLNRPPQSWCYVGALEK